jgi:hypothetical protein
VRTGKKQRAFLLGLLAALAIHSGCVLYEGPPQPHIEGGEDGVLDDPKSPLILAFSKPVDPSTLQVKIARLITDVEGNLGDEDAEDATELALLFSRDPSFPDVGGTAELIDGDTALRITPNAPLPIGAKLVLLIEQGLADTDGHTTKVRKRLLFSYKFDLGCDKPTTIFRAGKYFLLADVKSPLKTQVQLLASLTLDPATGRILGQFTNADRNPDKSRCAPLTCMSGDVCRLHPEPSCVAPSERAGTVDEFPDYVPNDVPPVGFTFTTDGCVEDQPDGSVVFVTAPVDVIVQSPPVTLRNASLTAQFTEDAAGALQGTGSLVADQVLLGTTPSGEGEGGLVARSLTDQEAPPGIPEPAPVP